MIRCRHYQIRRPWVVALILVVLILVPPWVTVRSRNRRCREAAIELSRHGGDVPAVTFIWDGPDFLFGLAPDDVRERNRRIIMPFVRPFAPAIIRDLPPVCDFLETLLIPAEVEVVVRTDLPLVRNLAGIEYVTVHDASIEDSDLSALEGITSLKGLELAGTRVGDSGTSCIATLTNLEELDLTDTPVTDEWMVKNVSHLSRLKRLVLYGTRISDRGVAAIASHAALEDIDLRETNVTDKTVKLLAGMKSLRYVSLEGTRVTREYLSSAEVNGSQAVFFSDSE